MRARSRWGSCLVVVLTILCGPIAAEDSARAQAVGCEEQVDQIANYRGSEAEHSIEVQRLAAFLQTPIGQDSRCRARGLRVLCELSPEAAIPVLQRWREQVDPEDQGAVAQCLLSLMKSQQEGAEQAVREYLFSDAPLSYVLLTMLQISDPASRELLAPLVRAIPRESPHRAQAFGFLCVPPTLARFRAECDAESARSEPQHDGSRALRQAPLHRRNPALARAITITTISVAIAGLHVGLSAYYRDSETNLGGLFAYQGALGGAMLIGGIGGAASLRKNVTLTQLAAAVILVPIGMVAAGIGGGIGGYKLGESPGNARVAVSAVSQSFILSTVLGFSWVGVHFGG